MPAPAADALPSTTSQRRAGGRGGVSASPWTVLASVAAGGALVAATAPLADPDLYWHLLAAREVVSRRSVHGIGASWSFTATAGGWTTTQWLSELVLSAVHGVAGLRGLMVLRVAVAVLVIVLLARLLLRPAAAVWGPVVFTLTLVSVTPFIQERPQLASLPLLVILSGVAWAVLQGGPAPPLWATAAATFLWANLHGLWVMVPSTLLLLATATAVARDGARARRLALTAVVAVVAACLTPVGPAILLSPLRFAAATGHIAEWQPTTPRNPSAIALDVVVLLLVLAWARTTSVVPGPELVYGLTLLAFAFLAYRNVAPAVILLSPVLLHRLQASFPRSSTAASSRERQLLVSTAVGALVVAVAVTGIRLVTVDPVAPQVPVALARRIAADGQPHRVLNDYNVAGIVLYEGHARVRVAIDGRADYYGARRIRQYLDLLALRPGWRTRLDALQADRALLTRACPLTAELLSLGWNKQASNGNYVLLARPAT